MAVNQYVCAKGNLDAYHLERSASDLDKVGLMRVEAQDDVPQSLGPSQGNISPQQTLFRAPCAVPLNDNVPFMDNSRMQPAPPQPSSFIPTLPAMEQGIHPHIPPEAYGNHGATPAGADANPSGGTPVYPTWSTKAPGIHFDPERGSMTPPVHQPSPVAPNQGAEVGQQSKAWCFTCDKGFHAPKALTRHNDDRHSEQRGCRHPDCDFTCIGARKLQNHLERVHNEPPPPRRVVVT